MLLRIFHKQTGTHAIGGGREILSSKPAQLKMYERFSHTALPEPRSIEESFSTLLARRASERDFDPNAEIPLASLSDILFAAAGIHRVHSNGAQLLRRFHPSGGGLYPLECYLAAIRVESVPTGIYHYRPGIHALEDLRTVTSIDKARDSYEPFFVPTGQDPAAICIITSVWGRNYPKYGDFAYRLSLMETGHMMQNMLLAGSARGVKAYPMSGFDLDLLRETLDISHEEEDPICLIPLGV